MKHLPQLQYSRTVLSHHPVENPALPTTAGNPLQRQMERAHNKYCNTKSGAFERALYTEMEGERDMLAIGRDLKTEQRALREGEQTCLEQH